MHAALSIRRLTKSFGGFALTDICLDVPSGYLVGFVGPNGAGKTTTIKATLGMVRPDSGDIQVLGYPPRAPELSGRVGVVLDSPALPGDWKVRDVTRALRGVIDHWDEAAYTALCERFALPPATKISALSRGMGMKIQVAVALATHPDLLILDEPTSGLDPLARDELLEILGDFLCADGHSVLLSTHITTDLDKIADYLAVIVAGRIVASGQRDDLLDAYALAKGGLGDAAAMDGELIGPRIHSAGFEALVRREVAVGAPAGVVVERPTVADLVIHLGKAA